jgi:hypothetical protein
VTAFSLPGGLDPQITAQIIGAVGAVVVALITLVGRRVKRIEAKIDGLRNGTYTQAMAAIAELQREREERRIAGLPVRRVVDRLAPEPAATSPAMIDEVRDRD